MDSKQKGFLIRLNRVIGWVLLFFAGLTIITGYGISRGILDRSIAQWLHRSIEWGFIGLLIIHFGLTILFTRYNWRNTFNRIKDREASELTTFRLLQRVSGWMILFLAGLVILTGLARSDVLLANLIPLPLHLLIDVFLIIIILVHGNIGLFFWLLRRRNVRLHSRWVLPFLTLLLGTGLIIFDFSPVIFNQGPPVESPNGPPTLSAFIRFNNQTYWFDPNLVTTQRPDIFRAGSFSLFDVLVHLEQTGQLTMEYSFDVNMNTHVIDEVNVIKGIWYFAHYSGGWLEPNVFRMDHYPWRNGTFLLLYEELDSHLNKIYQTYQDEVARKAINNGSIVIPEVIIIGHNFSKTFENVEIRPHNLRSDMFQENVTTAIDVILTLGDLGYINYELQWFDTVGQADFVRSYWVQGIDGNIGYGTCGFVYETGSWDFAELPLLTILPEPTEGNHIHLPSDIRVINSPEYLIFYWVCL